MQDIPLQTPPGNYNPGWLRKNRIWLLLIAFAAVFAYSCAAVVTTLGRPDPTRLSISIVVSDDDQIKASPKTLHHRVDVANKPSTQEFELTNASSSPMLLRFNLTARGIGFAAGNLKVVNLAAPGQSQLQGPIKLTSDLAGVSFEMQALTGLTPDGAIAANSAARFRLTATNDADQKDEEHFIILTITVVRDAR